jgi:hypothetical protein
MNEAANTIHLQRTDIGRWRVTNACPTPLERVALVERVHAAGGGMLQIGQCEVDVSEVRRLWWRLTMRLLDVTRGRGNRYRRAAPEAGRLCGRYLVSLGLPREAGSFEVLPADLLGGVSSALRPALVRGFGLFIQPRMGNNPDWAVFDLQQDESERFVTHFRKYLERCRQERAAWIAGFVERCEGNVVLMKQAGWTQARFAEALEDLLTVYGSQPRSPEKSREREPSQNGDESSRTED